MCCYAHSKRALGRQLERKFHDTVAVIVVITSIPSPYQVELFDALAEGEPGFRAVYVLRRDPDRSWTQPRLRHEAVFLEDDNTTSQTFAGWVGAANLVIFADYSRKSVREAMRHRESIRKPWCFWGERPGYYGAGWVGRLRRRTYLAPLHRDDHVPIWGIGKWAVEGYRNEFGNRRPYWNVPYFSNLDRFCAASASRSTETGTLRILYSGSLTKRKGVDLLAKAFLRLARARENVALSVIGTGPLRSPMKETLHPLGPRVQFHGFVSWDNLPKFYAQADVLCAPSRYDGWGLVVPEGMAAGMPIVATDRMGSALDLVEPCKNGWRVRAGDLVQLYQALYEAADMRPDDRKAMAVAARACSAQQGIFEGVRRFRNAMEGTLATWGSQHSHESISA